MKEKWKTAALVVLVAFSLYQSYLLAYSKPEFDPISQDEYIEAEWVGERKEPEELFFPAQIILHLGDDRHTVLYPGFQFYNLIDDKIRRRIFTGFRAVSAGTINQMKMRDEHRGLEIRFDEPVSMTTLRSLMQIRPDSPDIPPHVQRIWITMPADSEDVRTYFFAEGSTIVYEATQADLTVRDVEEFVGFGEYLPTYHPQRRGEYYLPNEPIHAMEIRTDYEQYTPEQLQKSLFVDPGTSRNLLERDGTEIYTDGKRGLQIYHARHRMTYSDPVAPVETNAADQESLLVAIEFINRHGGWNGDYLASEVEEGAVREYVFRRYYSPGENRQSWPILSGPELEFGDIRIGVQRGTTTHYERSMIELGDIRELQDTMLPGGDELIKRINRYERSGSIRTVFPAYVPQRDEDEIRLMPRWAARLDDGELVVLP